jgi:hypothetical protein
MLFVPKFNTSVVIFALEVFFEIMLKLTLKMHNTVLLVYESIKM